MEALMLDPWVFLSTYIWRFRTAGLHVLIGISDQSGGGIAILKQIVGKCNFGSCKEWDQDKTDSQIA